MDLDLLNPRRGTVDEETVELVVRSVVPSLALVEVQREIFSNVPRSPSSAF